MNVNSDLLNLNSKSPAFSIVIEGKDVTTVLDTRLMSLTLTDNRGFEADQRSGAGRRRRADRPAATWGSDSVGAGLERPAAFP